MDMTRDAAMAGYRKIESIEKYFTIVDGAMIFTGEKLEVRIPERYGVYSLLDIGDTVTAISIVDLIFDGKERCGSIMMAMVELDNHGLETVEIDGIPYIVVTLLNGDRFITNTRVMQNKNVVYAVFMEFMARGKLPYWIDYTTIFRLFDQSGPMCGVKIPVDHAIWEMIYSHLWRDAQNRYLQYRFTDMKGPGVMIGLTAINYATTNTSTKLIGANFPVGLNSALVQPAKNHAVVEDLLRT